MSDAAGEDDAGGQEGRTDDPASIPMHRCRVRSTRWLTPTLVEVDIEGLDDFETLGPDTFAYAIVTTDDSALPSDYSMADFIERDPQGPIRGAYYTVRRWDADGSVLTIWVLDHPTPSPGVGDWLVDAMPGAPLLLWGPRQGFVPPDDADHLVLVADETGLAAVAVIIETSPPTTSIVAIVETDGEAHRPPMPGHPRLDLVWVDRDRTGPDGGDALVDAVAALPPPTGVVGAFGGAESHVVTRVRTIVRQSWGVPAPNVSMVGYWRR